MQPTPQPDRPLPTLGRASRSAVGRLSGRFARLLGGSSGLLATGRFLRRHLWVRPLIIAAILGTAGWWVDHCVEDAMRHQRDDALNIFADASVAALRVWLADQRRTAELIADDEQLRAPVAELLAVAGPTPAATRKMVESPAQAALRSRLDERLRRSGYVGFIIVTPGGLAVAADHDAPVGMNFIDERRELITRAASGRAEVSRPFHSRLLLPDENRQPRAGLPTMVVVAPLRDADGQPVAVLALRIRPDDQFTKILQVAQPGKTGQTYAFDRTGLFLSQGRFDDDLRQIGLLAPESRSLLTLQVRDPQVNLTEGRRPAARREDQPLTRMAAAATAGQDGCDPVGYRDFRGVPVVGAWRWLDDYEVGVATELDVAEAYRPEYILRRAFWALMGLLVLAAAGIFVAMFYIGRQRRALQQAALAAKQLGQYTLEEKLGSGGMGTVYRARHAMLRRATAVKLLDPDKMSAAAVARFEREVQLTGGLTHPNTVAIYDYGRTPEGLFYYAMEYLEGVTLDELVSRHGPLLEARALHLLRQVCGALAEAHAAGLVHRDVKPANVFLTNRGGLFDFVKVLDFGLVKAVDGGAEANLTSPNAVTGTPLYLSPEAVNAPDRVGAGSDVYAIGAVGYFLLTGGPVFTGSSVMEICMKHVQAAPEPPSARLGRAVSPDLEALLLRCLAKSPADRPADAAALLRELEGCAVEGRWTAEEAVVWWQANGAPAGARATPPPAPIKVTDPGKDAVERTVVYEKGPG
jgi:hypothetical protein